MAKENKPKEESVDVIQEREFKAKVAELKKLGKDKLLEIIQIQPFNHELRDFRAARKALDELKVKYSIEFKVQCEEREIGVAFGKVKAEKPEDPVEKSEEKPTEKPEETEKKK